MGWDKERSEKRIRKHLDGLGRIEIEKLVRAADLQSLLSETCCREIYGAHVYLPVSNFPHLASEITTDAEYRQLIQATHLYQREVSRIVEDVESYEGLRVHFQGPKLHALFYRPIDDGQELAVRALLIQLVLRDFVRNVFNPAFADLGNFVLSGGADIGITIGTKNGQKADRELLFLGDPANRAAKIIRQNGYLRITDNLYAALPKSLQDRCEAIGDGDAYRVVPVEGEELQELLADHGHTWDPARSAERVEEDKDAFPLKDIEYSSATERIDFEVLSIFNNKKVKGASVFADVSGFTAYVEAAEGDRDEQRARLRVFHAIRKEMSAVIKGDFAGVRVQFQGDRVQGLFHVPKDEHAQISQSAVECAAGLHQSMELTLKAALPEADDLHLAIGIDRGKTLASKLGTRGHRDRICLGEAVEAAAEHEERCEAGETGIGKAVYDVLPEEVQETFLWSDAKGCYVASELTVRKLARLREARAYATAAAVTVATGSRGVVVSSREGGNGRQVVPARSYCGK